MDFGKLEGYAAINQRPLKSYCTMERAHIELIRDVVRHPQELGLVDNPRFYTNVPFIPRVSNPDGTGVIDVSLLAITNSSVAVIEGKYSTKQRIEGKIERLKRIYDLLRRDQEVIKGQFKVESTPIGVYKEGERRGFEVYTQDYFQVLFASTLGNLLN